MKRQKYYQEPLIEVITVELEGVILSDSSASDGNSSTEGFGEDSYDWN